MYLSTSDAKKKLCPMSRMAIAHGGTCVYNTPTGGSGCSADDCMAWVWENNKKNNENKGYCGLSSRAIQDEEQERKRLTEQFSRVNMLYKELDKLVYDVPFSIRVSNRMKEMDIIYVGEIVKLSPRDFLKRKNFGRISLSEIKDILDGMGLHLGMPIYGWIPPMKK